MPFCFNDQYLLFHSTRVEDQMGRKNWKEHVSQKGPGKKARKQKDPELPPKLREEETTIKKVKAGALGSRAKQRGKKRALKAAVAKSVLPEKETKTKKKVKKVKIALEETSPKQDLKINLFHETSDDGTSDGFQEMSDSSIGEQD